MSIETMPQYGHFDYWHLRYTRDDIPFDWMCCYEELRDTLTPLLQTAADDPTRSILVAGCGNAPFSSGLYYDGYRNLVNIDYCEVVIQQQKSRFPEMDWRVMNALSMNEFEDGQFDFIIDKSLSDTTLCYENGHETTRLLFTEFHRVLKPGGRIITVSLHGEDDVIGFSEISDSVKFAVSTGCLVSHRTKDHSSSSYHTIAVFDKLTGLDEEEKYNILVQHPVSFVNALLTAIDDDDEEHDDVFNSKRDQSEESEGGWIQRKDIFDDCKSIEDVIAFHETVFI